MIAGPRALVRLDAVRRNLDVVRRRAPAARVLAVVKANAYGHGLVQTARALAAADGLAVARLAEGVALRAAGIGGTVVVLEGAFSAAELAEAAAHQLEIVVHASWQIDLLESWRGTYAFPVWVKIDTGMNRLGFEVEEFGEVWQRLRVCRAVGAAPRLMTHLALADEPQDPATRHQIERFHRVAAALELERSVANSAGVLAWPDAHLEWVRPGIMLYGISPFADRDGRAFELEPAMTLETSVIALREARRGESVGYGAAWRASRDSRIAIAAIGYADGYPRHLGNGTPVLVSGRPATLCGRVSMDMIGIDVTDLGPVAVGDRVELWGAGLPVERVAARAGTIAYELVCGISQRVAVSWV